MKTKEFIKLLQEADPSGESHIRMYDGIPQFAELKPGYWDGPYEYIDGDKWVYSTQGSKVDIHCLDMYDFISGKINIHDPKKNNWEYIKQFFECDLTYSYPQDRIDGFYKRAKETFDEAFQSELGSYNRCLDNVREKAENGWTWFQNKKVDKEKKPNEHMVYTWKIFDENGKEEFSNAFNVIGVLYSGEWERVDNNKVSGYYQWIYKK